VQAVWKLVANPNSQWTFTNGDQFLYGEQILNDQLKQLGDFDTVDARREGDRYVGVQREQYVFKIADPSSPQGFVYKTCHWEFPVEISSVSTDRLDGRWKSYPPGSTLNPSACLRTGILVWEDVSWIRTTK
jgi:hypothetical protein